MGGAELSVVDFKTGALTWTDAWAFVVLEGGGGAVHDTQGFTLRTKEL